MSTKITYLDYEKSQGLEKEIESIQHFFSPSDFSENEHISKYPTPESYIRDYMLSLDGMEFKKQIDQLDGSCRVLDVGVCRGNTSIYLASRGHSVSVVEPSLEFCKLLELATNLYSLSLKIYNCNAESIQKINGLFDVIVFNSSLHHCDAPIKALKSCYSCLAERGKILIIHK